MTELVAQGRWTDLATGDLEGTGVDDLVLVDEEASDLVAFRIADGQLVRYYQAALGQQDLECCTDRSCGPRYGTPGVSPGPPGRITPAKLSWCGAMPATTSLAM